MICSVTDNSLSIEKSDPGRRGLCCKNKLRAKANVPASLRRKTPPRLPELSEFDVVRHYTRLSRLNFSVDTHFYPLGSCTMKYNPKLNDAVASYEGFAQLHPHQPAHHCQGMLKLLPNVPIKQGPEDPLGIIQVLRLQTKRNRRTSAVHGTDAHDTPSMKCGNNDLPPLGSQPLYILFRKLVKLAPQNRIHVRRFKAGAVVFHQLVRVQDV